MTATNSGGLLNADSRRHGSVGTTSLRPYKTPGTLLSRRSRQPRRLKPLQCAYRPGRDPLGNTDTTDIAFPLKVNTSVRTLSLQELNGMRRLSHVHPEDPSLQSSEGSPDKAMEEMSAKLGLPPLRVTEGGGGEGEGGKGWSLLKGRRASLRAVGGLSRKLKTSEYQLSFTYSDAVEKIVRRSMRGITSLKARVPASRDRVPQAVPKFPWSRKTVSKSPDTMSVKVHNLDKIETAGLQDFVLQGGIAMHKEQTILEDKKKERFRRRDTRLKEAPPPALAKGKRRRMSSLIPEDGDKGDSMAVLLARAGESDMADRALEYALEGLEINGSDEEGELDEEAQGSSTPVGSNFYGRCLNLPPPLEQQFTWELPPSRCDTVLTPSRLATPLQGESARKKKQQALESQQKARMKDRSILAKMRDREKSLMEKKALKQSNLEKRKKLRT